MSPKFRVVVTREGDLWLADVPELEGAHTDAKSLRTLDQYVREVIVMAADLPDEAMPGLELQYEYHLGDPELDERIARIRKNRELVSTLADRINRDQESVIVIGVKQRHLSQRDVAELIGVSHQRVSQLQG
jgi:hypothetical protein